MEPTPSPTRERCSSTARADRSSNAIRCARQDWRTFFSVKMLPITDPWSLRSNTKLSKKRAGDKLRHYRGTRVHPAFVVLQLIGNVLEDIILTPSAHLCSLKPAKIAKGCPYHLTLVPLAFLALSTQVCFFVPRSALRLPRSRSVPRSKLSPFSRPLAVVRFNNAEINKTAKKTGFMLPWHALRLRVKDAPSFRVPHS